MFSKSKLSEKTPKTDKKNPILTLDTYNLIKNKIKHATVTTVVVRSKSKKNGDVRQS